MKSLNRPIDASQRSYKLCSMNKLQPKADPVAICWLYAAVQPLICWTERYQSTPQLTASRGTCAFGNLISLARLADSYGRFVYIYTWFFLKPFVGSAPESIPHNPTDDW